MNAQNFRSMTVTLLLLAASVAIMAASATLSDNAAAPVTRRAHSAR